MRLFVIIIFLIITCKAIGQPREIYPEKDSAYYPTYNKVKELYIKQLHTKSYQKCRLLTNEYKKKWRSLYDGTGAELAKDIGGLKWLKKNWQKTRFKSYDEAVKEFEGVLASTTACQIDNAEFTKAYFYAVRRYGAYIYLDLEEEMENEYPDLY